MKKIIILQKKMNIFLIALLLLTLSGIPLIFFFSSPKLELQGPEEIVIDYQENYEDPGVVATYYGQDISPDVKVEGQVDNTNPGTYKIKYSVKKGLHTKEKERTIIVKDTRPKDVTAPVITLTGSENVKICPNKTYKEEGYKAIDDTDGDISNQVKVTTTKDKITYTVKDSHGNESTLTRTITYQDTTKPKITLKGSSSSKIILNSKYTDPGYTVTDNCDSNLASKVKVTNNVNPKQTGNYEITYEVTDSNGNKTKVVRKVKVYTPPQGGVIYLTFDDGPNAGTTNVILDILKEEGVKATFFVTNRGPDSLIKREYDEGHTIALHTASHSYSKVYASVDAYFNDLQIVHDRVQRITGVDSKIIRFPGGSSNTVSRNYSKGIMTTLTKEVTNRGYRYFDWNVSCEDAGGAKTKTAVYNNVVKSLTSSKVNMVLMHDIKPQTRDALRDIIHYAKENKFTFATIDENTPSVHHRVNN